MSLPAASPALARITEELLSPQASPGALAQAVRALHDLLAGAAGVSPDNPPTRESAREIWLPSGLALPPQDSARCLFDAVRTARYLRAADAALRELRKRFPGERLHLVYAGTGPYAPLALPLTARFSPDQLQLTLLEVNPVSREAAGRVVDALALRPWVRDVSAADAATYRVPSDAPMHAFVVEAMQHALTKEPQAAICANLSRQLAAGGVMIPERITVRAAMVDPVQEFGARADARADARAVKPTRESRIELGELLVLDLARAQAIGQPLPSSLEPVQIDVPTGSLQGYQLCLLTTLDLFGEIGLAEYESGLTHPKALVHDVPFFDAGDRLSFRLRLDGHPSWTFEYSVPSEHSGGALRKRESLDGRGRKVACRRPAGLLVQFSDS